MLAFMHDSHHTVIRPSTRLSRNRACRQSLRLLLPVDTALVLRNSAFRHLSRTSIIFKCNCPRQGLGAEKKRESKNIQNVPRSSFAFFASEQIMMRKVRCVHVLHLRCLRKSCVVQTSVESPTPLCRQTSSRSQTS